MLVSLRSTVGESNDFAARGVQFAGNFPAGERRPPELVDPPAPVSDPLPARKQKRYALPIDRCTLAACEIHFATTWRTRHGKIDLTNTEPTRQSCVTQKNNLRSYQISTDSAALYISKRYICLRCILLSRYI